MKTARGLEDHAISRHLANIVEYVKYHPDDLTLPRQFSIHHSASTIPQALREHIQFRKPGLYELDSIDTEYYYAVDTLTDGRPLIVLYDVTQIELSDRDENLLYRGFIAMYVLLCGIAWFLLRRYLQLTLLPLRSLGADVRRASKTPGKPIQFTSHEWTNDEVGILGKTIGDLSERVHAFISRERDFTRFVSHELRTPVTALKGALELMELKYQNQQLEPPAALGRIARSTKQMEYLIDVFLTLAREDVASSLVENDELSKLYSSAVEEAKYTLANSPVRIEESGELASGILISRPHTEIVLINLLRNAAIHSSDTTISITLAGTRVTISNQVNTSSSEGNGYNNGIGLRVVQRITDQQGWYFSFQRLEEHSTAIARVDFRPDESATGPSYVAGQTDFDDF
jgi:signal transduction histidine kinase